MTKRQKIMTAFLMVVIICTVVLLYLVWHRSEQAYGEHAEHAEQRQEEQQSESTGELEKLLWRNVELDGKKYRYSSDYETYLMIGTDESGNEDAGREDYVGNMADFLMLAVLNRKEKTYAFLPLNRDTMTEISLIDREGEGMATAQMQLCTAHWYGGTRTESCENTVKAVSDMLGGLTIDGYYELNCQDISSLNHEVGGVTVTIQNDLSSLDPEMKQGATITLNDEQAYKFIRSREGVEDEENTSRMERQKQYMEAMTEKLKEKTKADPETGLKIYDKLSDVSVTNMSGGLLTDILTDMQDAQDRGMYQIDGKIRTGEHLDDGISHTEVYLDQNSIVIILKKLYNIAEY